MIKTLIDDNSTLTYDDSTLITTVNSIETDESGVEIFSKMIAQQTNTFCVNKRN